MNREQLMNKVQSLGFAKYEAMLFLDTHPECQAALDYFRKVSDELALATEEYESKFGPLTANGVHGGEWSWISGPWPWQNMNEGRNQGDGCSKRKEAK